MPQNIFNVHLRKDSLVTVLEKKIYVHDLLTLHPIIAFETHYNPFGACAINQSMSNTVLALPKYPKLGSKPTLKIFHLLDRKEVNIDNVGEKSLLDSKSL